MDRADIDIIIALLDRESTIHELAKTMYKTTDQYVLKKHSTFLRYRLGQLATQGLVRRTDRGDGVALFRVPIEDMALGKARLVIQNGTGQITLDVGKVLVTQKDGDRQILVLKW
jgi:hypothetical protein